MTVAERQALSLKDSRTLGRHLFQRFGHRVRGDVWGGVVVDPDSLLEVVTYLKEDPALRADYLASLTSVDYEDRFEVVYHLASVGRQDGPLALKVHLDREEPEIPSLASIYAGAELQEREVWDLMGIRFLGHPNPRRILTWEGFQGHPLRKDWLEAYYEEEKKPFASRWPEIRNTRAEDRVPWFSNTRFPPGWSPADWAPPAEEPVVDVEDLQAGHRPKAQRFLVNMGPQHPSTHGVFQMRITLEGETVVDLEPVMGYLHRNHEKIGERNMYLMNMPYTDRLDYLSAMANNVGYAIAVERLAGMEVPERAEYLRVIVCELTRLANHAFVIGQFLSDLGAFHTPMLWGLTARERILDLFEAAAGSRMMCNYARFGGVFRDVPEGWLEQCRAVLDGPVRRLIDDFDDVITHNEIVRTRSEGIGILPPEVAVNYSLSGPMLRASGVPYDLRRADPYSIYDRFEFDVASFPNGDVYDRYRVRLEEMRQSVRILEQALRDIPEGPVQSGKPKWTFRVAPGEVYGRVENPKGELGYYLVADGTANPYRYHVRSPAFVNLTALGEMCKGHKVADVVAIFGAIDIVLGEVDR